MACGESRKCRRTRRFRRVGAAIPVTKGLERLLSQQLRYSRIFPPRSASVSGIFASLSA